MTVQLAGRFDRIVRHQGRLRVLDLKSGQDLSYSWGSIAIQLYLYANAQTIYDPATKTHTPMPADIDKEVGLVAHVPSESGTCTIYEVDLKQGNFGAILVADVQGYRKQARNIATVLPNLSPESPPVLGSQTADADLTSASADLSPASHLQDETGGAAQSPASPELRAYVQARVQAIKDFGVAARLAKSWPEEVPTLKAFDAHTETQVDLILAACVKVEAEAEMPFPAVDDPRTALGPMPPAPAPSQPCPSVDELEGPLSPDFEVEATREQFNALSEGQRAIIGGVVAEAETAGLKLAVKQHPSWRRLHIARALIALSDVQPPQPTSLAQLVRACLIPVLGDLQEEIPAGAYLGALTAGQAERFHRVVGAACGEGNMLIGWDESGPHLIGAVA